MGYILNYAIMIIDWMSLVWVLQCLVISLLFFVIMIFTFFIPAALLCKLSVEIHSSSALAMKRTDRRAIDTECEDCGKLFLHNCVHMINTGAVSTYARTA